jgi:hypothetical protein
MTDYLVEWSVEIEADDPTEAARMALEMHRDPASIATVFEVTGDDGLPVVVDLGQIDTGVPNRLGL